jgi:hypothetical protein
MNKSSVSKIIGGTSTTNLNRRSFLRRAGVAAAMVPLAGMAASGSRAFGGAPSCEDMDIEILNFALNLEYLEAEYYLYATTGHGLNYAGVGTDGIGKEGGVIVKNDAKVDFTTPIIAQYANEIAQDELTHVRFLRETLGAHKVAQPAIDLLNSFNTLGQAIGIGNFNPFEDQINFLLGAFIFEDVGVTAYHGAAPLITNKAYLAAAAGILGTEAYHASEVRTVLLGLYADGLAPDAVSITQKISNLRDSLDGAGDDDQGITLGGQANIVPTDGNGLVFARTPQQVLNIVYGKAGATKGLFFPNGINEP